VTETKQQNIEAFFITLPTRQLPRESHIRAHILMTSKGSDPSRMPNAAKRPD
jgi:hypothetical protein